MINITYTGADKALAVQGESNKSLGGYISATQVPNNFIGNLFPTISQLSQQESREDVRVIAVQNTSGSAFTSFELYINEGEKESIAKWEIGSQLAVIDDCGDLVVESIPNAYATPINVVMQAGVGYNNRITLPNLADNAYVGIYIKRLTPSQVVDEEADIALADAYDEGTVLDTEEIISLEFSYT
jgi:hypothetical protein